MDNIKSFIYLDEYKMYSISSQLFEGLTEYILSGEKESITESEQQKGSLGSGRVMGDILVKEKDSSEKRFLHDYAFELLEKELEARGKLYTPCNTDTIEDIIDKSFIRIKGKIFFNDYKASTDTLLNFNTLGEGLGYIQYFDNSGKVKDELKELTNKAKDREQRNKVGLLKKEIDKRFEEYLKGNGLRLDEKWLDHLKNIVLYGYKNNLEILLPAPNNILFSSVLNRDFLKENIDSLIYKYSRKSEVEFTIIGTITQIGNSRANLDDVHGEGNAFKSANRNILNILAKLEDSFTSRLENECIIDPIAIYR